ncbi:MAG: putative quinol monooxygenase [Erythrobacter sp.]
MAKIVISAQIDLANEKREQAVKDAKPLIEAALAQDGCIHYDWSIDPSHPTRVNVFEEWESEDALAYHFANNAYGGMIEHLSGVGILGATSRKYRVDAEDEVYGPEGAPTAQFT